MNHLIVNVVFIYVCSKLHKYNIRALSHISIHIQLDSEPLRARAVI